MDQSARGWMFKKARSSLWRMKDTMDLDELLQEGWLCWIKVGRKYPHITHAPHLMELFKTTFTNHIHDLAEKASRQLPTTGGIELGDIASFATNPDTSEVLALMPPGLAKALVALATDPRALTTFRWVAGQWETPDEKLCRLAGVKPECVPLLEQVRMYLRDQVDLHPRMVGM